MITEKDLQKLWDACERGESCWDHVYSLIAEVRRQREDLRKDKTLVFAIGDAERLWKALSGLVGAATEHTNQHGFSEDLGERLYNARATLIGTAARAQPEKPPEPASELLASRHISHTTTVDSPGGSSTTLHLTEEARADLTIGEAEIRLPVGTSGQILDEELRCWVDPCEHGGIPRLCRRCQARGAP